MALFQWGNFTLHSGERSWWRIDCDDLTDSEVALLAKMIAERVPPFKGVHCPPSHQGSVAYRLAEACRVYMVMGNARILIVDDVLTTGASMEAMRGKDPQLYVGAVIFARGQCPDWITPLFTLSPNQTNDAEGDE